MVDYNIHIKETKERYIFGRDLSDISVGKFKYQLRTVHWDSITNSSDANKAYNEFIEIFSSLYDECFPKMKNKTSKVQNPRKLYEKFLKNRNEKNEKLYKSYKSLFEFVKRKPERIYYSSKILEFKNKANKTWGGKIRNTESSLPKKLVIKR